MERVRHGPVSPASRAEETALTTTAHAGLAQSIRACARVAPDLRLWPGPQPGSWLTCAELLAPATLAEWAAGITRWLRAAYGEAPDRTVAGYLLSWYLTVPAKTAALLFHTARQVPRIDPAALAIRFDGARPAEVALLDDRFTCLPGDPAAGLPGATTVPDERALAAVWRGRYAAHAARFLFALTEAVDLRLGRRTLWATATDALDGACWRVGQALGETAIAARNAALVLPAAPAPFTSASTMRTDSAGEWTRRRESCCFHYVLTHGMGTCATCPRVCDR